MSERLVLYETFERTRRWKTAAWYYERRWRGCFTGEASGLEGCRLVWLPLPFISHLPCRIFFISRSHDDNAEASQKKSDSASEMPTTPQSCRRRIIRGSRHQTLAAACNCADSRRRAVRGEYGQSTLGPEYVRMFTSTALSFRSSLARYLWRIIALKERLGRRWVCSCISPTAGRTLRPNWLSSDDLPAWIVSRHVRYLGLQYLRRYGHKICH